MFIRKRTNKTKDGKQTESYQVIETYRENAKVKQRVICNLSSYSTPQKALESEKRRLLALEEKNKTPVKTYGVFDEFGSRSPERIERIKAFWLKEYKKCKIWVEELEVVVSKMSTNVDGF